MIYIKNPLGHFLFNSRKTVVVGYDSDPFQCFTLPEIFRKSCASHHIIHEYCVSYVLCIYSYRVGSKSKVFFTGPLFYSDAVALNVHKLAAKSYKRLICFGLRCPEVSV